MMNWEAAVVVYEQTIFKSEAGVRPFEEAYDRSLGLWSVAGRQIKVNTAYGETHVIVSGPENGKPILLFHGMTGNSTMWYETVPALQKYRTYCIDVPGDFGRSTILKPLKTKEDCIDWIEQLLTSLGLERVALIGHSMGGWLSANFALHRPERVNMLVLLAPVSTILPIPFLKLMRHVYPSILSPNPKRIRKTWDWFLGKGNSLHPVVLEQIITAYTFCRPKLAVIPHIFPKEMWEGFRSPILFLVGDEEVIYHAKHAENRVRTWIPSAEFETVPRAGHCLITEQAEYVNKSIVRFLDKYSKETDGSSLQI